MKNNNFRLISQRKKNLRPGISEAVHHIRGIIQVQSLTENVENFINIS